MNRTFPYTVSMVVTICGVVVVVIDEADSTRIMRLESSANAFSIIHARNQAKGDLVQLSIGNHLINFRLILHHCRLVRRAIQAEHARPREIIFFVVTAFLRRRLLFVKVVIFVILRPLKSQLKCEAILGDLVDPYSRGNFSRSRVSSALLARFGGSVRLP